MIERFNFYDLYAYLIPGLAIVAALGLPFGLATGQWPDADFTSAAALILAGYLVGLVMHELAARAPWLNFRVLPSARILDPKDVTTAAALREQLLARAARELGLQGTDPAHRDPIFRLARTRVVHDQRGTYVEQFNGLHGMTRTLSYAAALASGWYAGWLVQGLLASAHQGSWAPPGWWRWPGVVLALWGAAGLCVDIRVSVLKEERPADKSIQRWRALTRWSMLAWPLLLTVAGLFAASRRSLEPHLVYAPLLFAVVTVLVCWRASRSYANLFAREVYYAYLASPAASQELDRRPPP